MGKMQKEIDSLREKLAMKTTGVLTNDNNQSDNGQIMSILQGDQVIVNNISNENRSRSQSDIQVNRNCENCKCNSTIQDELNSVRLSDSQNIVNHGSLVNGHPLNELTLPIFDNATQVVGNFLKDLDLYFDLKGVSENLKLPLASKAIRDPFTKAWLSAEYYGIIR
jgi:hypothetical protein